MRAILLLQPRFNTGVLLFGSFRHRWRDYLAGYACGGYDAEFLDADVEFADVGGVAGEGLEGHAGSEGGGEGEGVEPGLGGGFVAGVGSQRVGD